MAQHRVNVAGDAHAVLGADVAPVPEIIRRDGVGRPLAGIDRGENIDRGCDLRAWCQAAPEGQRSAE